MRPATHGAMYDTPPPSHQDKDVEVPLDSITDVMAKYLLENMLCRSPADRMALRDAAVYADQIGSEADYYGGGGAGGGSVA